MEWTTPGVSSIHNLDLDPGGSYFYRVGAAQTLEAIYTGVARAVEDPELPVRVSAALALMGLIQHEEGALLNHRATTFLSQCSRFLV